MRIRPFEPADRAAVVDLWRRTGLTRPWNDPDRDIDRKLADSPWGLLVGELPGTAGEGQSLPGAGPARHRVVAAMLVGYDGHRGSVNYLAVDPDVQGRGLGHAMMDHAEALLLARGCPKVNLQVRSENARVVAFYQRRGYVVEGSLIDLGLRLIRDDAPA